MKKKLFYFSLFFILSFSVLFFIFSKSEITSEKNYQNIFVSLNQLPDFKDFTILKKYPELDLFLIRISKEAIPENLLKTPDIPVRLADYDLMAENPWISELTFMSHPSGTQQVKVAVLDTGCSPDQCQNWNSENADDHGHGTEITSIIRSISDKAIIIPIKVLDKNGYGMVSDVVSGILQACSFEASVINLSLGTEQYSEILHKAVSYAVSRGCTVVAASGNTGSETLFYPAAIPEATAISSLSPDLTLSSFSGYGDFIDYTAPGELYTSGINGKVYRRGTSYAAAVFSGQLAFIASFGLSVSPDSLLYYTTDHGEPEKDIRFGHGYLKFPAFTAETSTFPSATGITSEISDSSAFTLPSYLFRKDYTVEIPRPEIINFSGRDSVTIDGFGNTGRFGYPSLPHKKFYFEIPDSGLCGIDVTPLNSESLYKTFSLKTVSKPENRLSSSETVPDAVLTEIYPAESFKIQGTEIIEGHNTAVISLFPVQYDLSGNLIYHSRFQISLLFSSEIATAQGENKTSGLLGSRIIENFGEFGASDLKAQGISGYDYLIITTLQMKPALEPLAQWKTQKGVKAVIETVEDIRSRYAGNDDADRIRNCISDYYNSGNGIDWVLLAGDSDDIMVKIFKDPHWDQDPSLSSQLAGLFDHQVPSDYFYAKVTGSWDNNGINSQGWVPDVCVGRLPASTLSDMQTLVQNILSYEMNPPSGTWAGRAVLAAAFSNHQSTDWNRTDDATMMEKMRSDGFFSGFTLTRLYQDENSRTDSGFAEIDPTDFTHEYSLCHDNFLSQCGQGQSIINWAGHGWTDNVVAQIWYDDRNHNNLEESSDESDWPVFFESSDNLDNGAKKSFVYADSCLTGAFDWIPYPPAYSLGESVIRKSGIGFIGASRTSYYSPGWSVPADGMNQTHDYLFMKELLKNGNYQPGAAFWVAKYLYTTMFSHISRVSDDDQDYGQYDRKNLHAYNLLGDPELSVYTSAYSTLEISHASSVAAGNRSVTVNAKSLGIPVSGISICLYKSGEVYLTGTTDSSGNAGFSFTVSSTGDILVTATAHNKKPSQSLITVSNTPPSVPVLNSPADHAVLNQSSVTLTVQNPSDPDLDQVYLEFQLSLFQNFSATVASSGKITAETGISTSYTPAYTLLDNTDYYWRARSSDIHSSSEWSSIRHFRYTATDETPPGDVTLLSASPLDSSVVLSWKNPADGDLSGLKVIRKQGSTPETLIDGIEIFSGITETLTNNGLINGLKYFFRVFCFDLYGNYSTGETVSVTPFDNQAPSPPADFMACSATDRINVYWTNPTGDFSGVCVLKKQGSYPVSRTDGSIVYNSSGASFPDTSVTTGVMYYYAAYSYDSSHNSSELVTDKAMAFSPVPSGSAAGEDFSGLVPEAKPGDVIFIRDKNGNTCGYCTVMVSGSYGPLRVYGDDPVTPSVEGPAAGDELFFYLNGIPIRGAAVAVFKTSGSFVYDLTGGNSRMLHFDFTRGWNMFSVNFTIESCDLQTVLAPVSSCYDKLLCWNGPEAGYTVFDSSYPQYATLNEITPGYGYWIRVITSEVSLSLEGEAVTEHTFRLSYGWNMVGYPAPEVRQLTDAFQQISGQYDKVLCWYGPETGYRVYDVSYPQFATLTTCEPGKSYWIRVTAPEAVLTLSE